MADLPILPETPQEAEQAKELKTIDHQEAKTIINIYAENQMLTNAEALHLIQHLSSVLLMQKFIK